MHLTSSLNGVPATTDRKKKEVSGFQRLYLSLLHGLVHPFHLSPALLMFWKQYQAEPS